MRRIATLDGKDYTNLDIKYSDKNVIYNIQGKESIIDSAESVTLESATAGVENPYTMTITINDVNYKTTAGQKNISGVFSWNNYFRVEEGYLKGSFYFDTEEIITDKNSIALEYTLYYKEYSSTSENNGAGLATKDNYKSQDFIMTKLIKDNDDEEKTTDTYIPRAKSSANYYFIDSPLDIITPTNFKQQIKLSSRVLPNGSTRITVDYFILVYTGQNEFSSFAMLGINKVTKDIVRFVNKIDFKITSNIVDVQELDFNYTSDYGDNVTSNYELSTNELLQTTEDELIENKKSYNICKEIFEQYRRDKQIITFDLLNIVKYDTDTPVENTDPIVYKKRFLMPEDTIYIKDELGEYIGKYYNELGELVIPEYKIIGLEKIWDGSLYFKVTAIQINN